MALYVAVAERPCAAQLQIRGETPEQAQEQQRAEKRIAENDKKKRPRLLPANYASSEAYANPPVTLSTENIGKFAEIMRSLAAQGKVAILAEGTPVHGELRKEQTSDLIKALAGSDGTLNGVLSVAADAFDYRPIRIDSSTILLSKTFHDPNDLPFVTYEEALFDLHAVKGIVSTIDPDVPIPIAPNSPLINFLIEATQQHGAGALRAGLPIDQLSPAESEVAEQYAVSCYLGGAFGPANRMLIAINGQ